MAADVAGGSSSPCGACKFLRRKCAAECVFAAHFASEQGPARFAAIHKVFGASNASKMLQHLPLPDRFHAVPTIAYEAQARIRNPVHGCVAHIFALQHQVVLLQDELVQMRAQLALAAHHQSAVPAPQQFIPTMQDCVNVSDRYWSSLDSIDGFSSMQQHCGVDDEVVLQRPQSKRRRRHEDLSDLQQMALMMINNGN